MISDTSEYSLRKIAIVAASNFMFRQIITDVKEA